MPVHVAKRGKKFCVVDVSGIVKKGRCHGSRSQAIAQAQAININLIKSGKIKPKRKTNL